MAQVNVLTVDSIPKNLAYHVNDNGSAFTTGETYTFYWTFDDSLMPTLEDKQKVAQSRQSHAS